MAEAANELGLAGTREKCKRKGTIIFDNSPVPDNNPKPRDKQTKSSSNSTASSNATTRGSPNASSSATTRGSPSCRSHATTARTGEPEAHKSDEAREPECAAGAHAVGTHPVETSSGEADAADLDGGVGMVEAPENRYLVCGVHMGVLPALSEHFVLPCSGGHAPQTHTHSRTHTDMIPWRPT